MKRMWVWLVILTLVLFLAAPVWADRGPGGGSGEGRSGEQERIGGQDDTGGDVNDDNGGDANDDRGADDADDEGSDDNGQGDQQHDRDRDRDGSQDRDQDREQDRQQDREQDQTRAQVRNRFSFEGVIVGVDRTSGMVTVLVRDLSKPEGSSAQPVRVQAQAGTLLQKRTGSVWARANLSDLQPGQTILSHGTINGDTWIASRVRVGKKL
jgi:hypothetical protein